VDVALKAVEELAAPPPQGPPVPGHSLTRLRLGRCVATALRQIPRADATVRLALTSRRRAVRLLLAGLSDPESCAKEAVDRARLWEMAAALDRGAWWMSPVGPRRYKLIETCLMSVPVATPPEDWDRIVKARAFLAAVALSDDGSGEGSGCWIMGCPVAAEDECSDFVLVQRVLSELSPSRRESDGGLLVRSLLQHNRSLQAKVRAHLLHLHTIASRPEAAFDESDAPNQPASVGPSSEVFQQLVGVLSEIQTREPILPVEMRDPDPNMQQDDCSRRRRSAPATPQSCEQLGSLSAMPWGKLTPRACADVTQQPSDKTTPARSGTLTPRGSGALTPRGCARTVLSASGTTIPCETGALTPRSFAAVTPRGSAEVPNQASGRITPRGCSSLSPRDPDRQIPQAPAATTPRGSTPFKPGLHQQVLRSQQSPVRRRASLPATTQKSSIRPAQIWNWGGDGTLPPSPTRARPGAGEAAAEGSATCSTRPLLPAPSRLTLRERVAAVVSAACPSCCQRRAPAVEHSVSSLLRARPADAPEAAVRSCNLDDFARVASRQPSPAVGPLVRKPQAAR